MRRIGLRCTASAALALLAAAVWASTAVGAATNDPAQYVNPFIGTAAGAQNYGTGGGAANTFPGPVLPGGMIQLGPDTRPSTDNVGGGYAYSDGQIRGFSLRHMSGSGCPNYGDVPITPTSAPITSSPVQPFALDLNSSYIASYNHQQEAASPGYYQVRLNPSRPDAVGAELTSTTRAGLARFTYSPSQAASVLINAAGSAEGNRTADVQIDPAQREVSGSATSGGFCLQPDEHRLYFVAQFSRPFTAFGTWRKQLLEPGSTSNQDAFLGQPFTYYPFSGDYYHYGLTAQTGAYVTFAASAERTVEMRIGISYVSVQAARQNLEAETAGRSFDAIRAQARAAWNQALLRVEVNQGASDYLRRFYTALYQAFIEPATFSDVDGRYIGMDGQVHVARGYTQYADLSGWDIYRSQIPLLALLRPTEASDVAQSLVADAAQSGWLPKWPVANGQTGVMTGDPADPIIAAAYALGARGFDAGAALQAMVRGATQLGHSANDGYVEREGLTAYMQLGYIPNELNGNNITEGLGDWSRLVPSPTSEYSGLPWGSAGTTLEYSSDDFAISQLARALGDAATCRAFLMRSGNWRHLFNSATGYIEPRSASGAFIPGYNPNYNDPVSTQGFAEGDAAQYTWMIPHDPAGLAAAMGGSDAAARRLATFFTDLNDGISSPYAFLGNEPGLNSPWLFDWFGQPYRTQQVLRRALVTLYPDNPGGFPGNDDLGTMSAWYVFSALGLYPEIPGTDVLALSGPLFRDVTLHLAGGDVHLRAPQAGPDASYIQSVELNGHPHNQPWLRLSDLASGSTLNYGLSASPNRAWGASPADAPPSFSPTGPSGCGPTAGASAPALLGLPARPCVSRRRLTIHLRPPAGQRLRSVTVAVNGKRVRTLHGSRSRVPINLTGLPRGRYRVTVTAVTTAGRRLTVTRHYRTCRPVRRQRELGRRQG
ncbi:MAG TPA: GH92 family glycosyl hydrolase [Solirubrobacteraceae bacterium]|jgi:predicted alpha-1,2-mannosidase|nr:GH92 family glycosyl hydrolase [Solirubrobacteraceae bacterium]